MWFFSADLYDEAAQEARKSSLSPHAARVDETGSNAVDLMNLIATLSDDVPDFTVGRGVLVLAKFLSTHQETLSDDQAATLLALAAGLWRRSIALDENADEARLVSATKQ